MPPKPGFPQRKSIQDSRTNPVMGKERRTDSLCLPALSARVFFSFLLHCASRSPAIYTFFFLARSLDPGRTIFQATVSEENLLPELSVRDFKSRFLPRGRIYVTVK